MKNICITSAKRTAIGSLGKSLKNVNAEDLGSAVISSVVENSKLKLNDLDEVIMGQVLTGGSGQNPARQASIKSGVPKETPAYIVNQVCGSGIRSVASGFQSIMAGDSKILVAGGQENMSLAPHAIHLRDGKKLGDEKNCLTFRWQLTVMGGKRSGKVIDDNDYTYCPNKGFTKLVSRK